jgi:RND family efflux transporter MFP subunit
LNAPPNVSLDSDDPIDKIPDEQTMSTEHPTQSRTIQALAAIAGLILLLIWMEGGFSRKTPPGTVEAAEREAPPGPTVQVRKLTLQDWRDWPAQVTARSTAQLGPKIAARVLEIPVKAGDAIEAGQVVARLDASEWQARVNQARSNLAAAEAEAARAAADARRVQDLYAKEAATARQQETAQASARAASAQVAAARAAIAEAQAQLAETVLRAPFDGFVVRRELEPGDLASPAKPVVTVQTEKRLRVEADIPESCAARLTLGQTLSARLGADVPHPRPLSKGEMGVDEYPARLEEIAPAADPRSRTVHIKAALDAAAQPGAFAWLRQSCGEREVLLIPAGAVQRAGQLESVRVLIDGKPRLRHVRTGKAVDGQVEILSGLHEGDEVLTGGAR